MTEERAKEFHQFCDQALLHLCDPVGLGQWPESRAKHIQEVFELAKRADAEDALQQHLVALEGAVLGRYSDSARAARVAELLARRRELIEQEEASPDRLAQELAEARSGLFAAFSNYEDKGSFCTYCHTSDEIREFSQTPLRELEAQAVRKLLWEPWDHWDNQDVYRHFLPRILEAMGPPEFVEDIFTEHLFHTLRELEFSAWPMSERAAVTRFLAAIEPYLDFDFTSWLEWRDGIDSLVEAT